MAHYCPVVFDCYRSLVGYFCLFYVSVVPVFDRDGRKVYTIRYKRNEEKFLLVLNQLVKYPAAFNGRFSLALPSACAAVLKWLKMLQRENSKALQHTTINITSLLTPGLRMWN